MAVVFIPGVPKIFATNSVGTPTALYIYADGVQEAEMRDAVGSADETGTLVDGKLTDWFQGLPAGNDAAQLGSTVALEQDTDANSPFIGRFRIKITIGATAT